ncbi:MAG TPA: SpoIIE family protein phosphatase [Acidimicrobiales bacterium]
MATSGLPMPGGVEALLILEGLPLAVVTIDADGLFRYVNEAAAKLLGAAAEDVVGEPAISLAVAAGDTGAALDLVGKVASGEPWTGRFPVTRPDGGRVNTWFVAVPYDGGLLALGAAAEELAASIGLDAAGDAGRVEAEEANRLLATLLDSVPVGMAFFDRALRFVRVNKTMATTDGVAAERHVGRAIAEVLAGWPSSVLEDVAAVFETGEVIADRHVATTSASDPGSTHHWLISYYPVRLRGSLVWVGATVVDVTEWRRNEQERVRLLEAEKSARLAVEEAVERLARLQVVTARLAEATTRERVAEIVVTHGAAGLGAAGAALLVTESATGTDANDRDGNDRGDDNGGDVDHLVLVHSAGFEPGAMEKFATVPLDAPLPIAEALRRRDIVLVHSIADRDDRYPLLAGIDGVCRSYASAPLAIDDRLLGGIALGWAVERVFTDADRDFVLALGRQASLALERVRLYEAERTARALAELARERMAFLAEASRVLGSSLDYRDTLSRLSQLAVREIADACTIHLVEDDDLRLVGAAHRDPAREPALVEASSRTSRQPRLLGQVLVTGAPIVLPAVADDAWAQIAYDEDHLRQLRALELASVVVVPLASSGRVVGVLSLGSHDVSRYTSYDLAFVEDVAARAAVAIENSLAHQARTEVARTLQQSLLPPVKPTLQGLEVAQRYHSAGDVEVGGDFFDVFPAGDGRWGVVMGDVCGKGIAAASLTALARYTVRAAAIEGAPWQVLHLLNRAILEADTDERFCTIVHAVVEPLDASARVTLACGGHPLPLVVRANGAVEEIGTPGTVIGLFEEIEITEVEETLRPGDAFVLYTDGFVEVRSPDGAFAPRLLHTALAGAAGGSAEQLADAVDRAVLAFEGGHPRDDMALLILRVPDGLPPR